jgi:competence protein ComEC
VLVYVLLFAFLLSENRKPMIFGSCAMLGLCMALLASWAEPAMEDVRFTVLDVGQGQCLLMQTEGKTYMVDCGGSSDAEAADIAAETLLSQGISELDGLILTHYDRDHAGGAEYLLSRVPAKLLVLPPLDLQLSLEAEQILYGADDLLLTWGNTKIRIFASQISGNDNENSLCVLFDTENCDILVTGDRDGFGERMLLRTAEIPEVDILVAGHHGAKSSTSAQLLTATMPKIVVISVGENHYGHPAQEVLDRIAAVGAALYRTDLHGNIILRR